MRDPREGLTADGMITTGVSRDVPAPFAPLVAEVVAEFERARLGGAELHVYGSVATGQARPGESDVDLLLIDGSPGWARDAAGRLSRRHAELCRGVEIGVARGSDYAGDGDEAYGNRVFLRHYCVPLAGADALRDAAPFPGDARAARGFNGDIARHLARWRTGGADPRRVARKTLVAAAGIVSVENRTWTTDRATAVELWAHPTERDDLARLFAWSTGAPVAPADLTAALGPDGIVATVAARFAAVVGLWSEWGESP